jgi:protein TonB
MLHELPITNVRLNACFVGPEQFTDVAEGRFCAACQRTVHDFTHATAADLARARAASPDGQLCGRFRLKQLAPESRPLTLRPKLRRFLWALVLVVLQGFTAQQAWAQVKHVARTVVKTPLPIVGGVKPPPQHKTAAKAATFEGRPLYVFADQMPVYKNGGIEGLARFLAKHIRYPADLPPKAAGKVLVTFIIDGTGKVRNAQIKKSIGYGTNEEVLHAVRQLMFIPGKHQGKPVDVEFTLPITFATP